MTYRQFLIFVAAGGSVALLGGALVSQYFFGLQPCEMCLWQRWPHAAAIGIGVLAFVIPAPVLSLLGALAAFVTGAIGVFHTGVERHWWEGITECTGTDGILNSNINDLLNPAIDAGPPLIRCDQVAFEFLGLSMASWNAILSFVLVAIWFASWKVARGR